VEEHYKCLQIILEEPEGKRSLLLPTPGREDNIKINFNRLLL
jgi:hypothetical protein